MTPGTRPEVEPATRPGVTPEVAPLHPPAGPLMVIAPHPDDETLGCGGLIAHCIGEGQPVHVVFVTDGGASHPGSPTWSRARLAACREAEAGEALRRLATPPASHTFLRLPDAAMPPPGSAAHGQAVATIARLLADLQPALLVLPWRRDPHCDHRDSWELAMAALEACRSRSRPPESSRSETSRPENSKPEHSESEHREPEILEYAIWLDELGAPEDRPRPGEMEAVALPVSPALKRHALEAHRSQLGLVVPDDPGGFVLEPATVARLSGPEELYWRPCSGR